MCEGEAGEGDGGRENQNEREEDYKKTGSVALRGRKINGGRSSERKGGNREE